MATALSVRCTRAILCRDPAGSARIRPTARRPDTAHIGKISKKERSRWGLIFTSSRRTVSGVLRSGSRADDSAPFEMSVENAMKLLGVSEGASFDDILRAKNSIVAACKDDQETISQVEAAYDMLLMQSLSQRRSGKVVNSSIRYADVKPVNAPTMGSMPQWLQATITSAPVSVEAPSSGDLGIQAGVYGALMVLTYVNGDSTSSAGLYGGVDVHGLILATSFGATLYFMTKRNVKLGKATLITIGGLVAGAVVGSGVENWLQVDIVPFLGIHSTATLLFFFSSLHLPSLGSCPTNPSSLSSTLPDARCLAALNYGLQAWVQKPFSLLYVMQQSICQVLLTHFPLLLPLYPSQSFSWQERLEANRSWQIVSNGAHSLDMVGAELMALGFVWHI